jgi:hypothetical protein
MNLAAFFVSLAKGPHVTSMALPIDTLITRLKIIVSDAAHTGFGTIRTSDDGTTLEFSIPREKIGNRLEAFESFAMRVFHLTEAGDTVEWSFREREITIARITRPARM